MNVINALKNRISANKFDSSKILTEDDVRYLVAAAMESPSAYNIQHARFLAVVDSDAKNTLRELSYHQAKVSEASVTFVVLADVEGYKLLPTIGARAVSAGLFDQTAADRSTKMATDAYSSNATFARDEAIRSGSMAAMSLMLAAEEKGWVTGPMIGFDAEKLKAVFNLDDRYLPVMLITVGYGGDGNWPRKPRLTSADVLSFDARPHQTPAFIKE
jgi:nitroreductase